MQKQKRTLEAGEKVMAGPFAARQCPECGEWILTGAGPFAEGDRTKTEADWLHWEAKHLPEGTDLDQPIGFPLFMFNEATVEATVAQTVTVRA